MALTKVVVYNAATLRKREERGLLLSTLTFIRVPIRVVEIDFDPKAYSNQRVY